MGIKIFLMHCDVYVMLVCSFVSLDCLVTVQVENIVLKTYRLTKPAKIIKVPIFPASTLLVVGSDMHILGSPLMSAEATRMQDLASEFSKIFPR